MNLEIKLKNIYFMPVAQNQKLFKHLQQKLNSINYYQKKKFYYDLISYEATYKNLKKRIINLFNEEKTKFIDSLKIPDLLVDKLKKKVKEFIAESYQF